MAIPEFLDQDRFYLDLETIRSNGCITIPTLFLKVSS